MPNIKSAKKALRQSKKRKIKNLKTKEVFKSVLKEIRKLVSAGETAKAKEILPRAYQALDKAAKTGVLKKNAASRKKSRLTKLLVKAAK